MSKKYGLVLKDTIEITLPKESVIKIIDAVVEPFNSILGPPRALLDAITRKLKLMFGGFEKPQKVNGSLILYKTWNLLEKEEPINKELNSTLICKLVENGSEYSSDEFQDMWASLIVEEITHGLHPEFPRILRRMSKVDVLTLYKIATEIKFQISTGKRLNDNEIDFFTIEQLERLGLIQPRTNSFWLTRTGEKFLEAAGVSNIDMIADLVNTDEQIVEVIEDSPGN